jgi:2-polyprenyl-3-methyl-5-hydroxy-6-metoxy-1,4-benzoquinol methylase
LKSFLFKKSDTNRTVGTKLEISRTVPFAIEQHNATGSISYWQEGDHQSQADKNGVSLAEFMHAIFGLLRQAKCRRVLMIGCGGGTLATMLHRVGVEVTIVDIDPSSFEVARQYFHMPNEIECHVADGRAFLRKGATPYDAVVLDAFSKQVVPTHLLSPSFFALVKSRMRPRGSVFLINLIVADDDDPLPFRVVENMRHVWREARLLDHEEWEDRNAIALAGAVGHLKRPRLMMTPARRAKYIANSLSTMRFRHMSE